MDGTARTLVILAHPALEQARIHPPLAAAAEATPGVAVRDLYETYPDFAVDAPAEQADLAGYDHLVLQFPFYWYAAPALLKEWLDVVLTHGFAYGDKGERLRCKTLGCAVSTGGGALARQTEGLTAKDVGLLLRPLELTARLCGMRWAEPFIVRDADLTDQAALKRAAAAYSDWLGGLGR
ncbi:NAD(P)H-dependent oxidoreductase [Brevundimonas sp. 2R-24]|uniref:NAD(P)H-dependent oxidoreductase n=1 Tax=Peiella sedimenti TaxID=3061083 RepID=A0ABT8SGZ3_9CAUL|nr:NAD(P)H-dependent oxidoreductase [Caulobacteraceae bacterium XZ-24]